MYEAPVFVVEDGSQPPVELAAKDRNIIAATFTNFLLKNIGISIFESKTIKFLRLGSQKAVSNSGA